MFDLKNIIEYTNSNMQIIGIFIAIIGGLIATKLLNLKIEKDTLLEKLDKINKEIDFNKQRIEKNEEKIYLKNKEDFIYCIYDKNIFDDDFNLEDYDDYGLTLEQREKILYEVKVMKAKAYKLFEKKHSKDDVNRILKENHIKEDTIEYLIYDDIGYKTGEKEYSYSGLNIPDIGALRLNANFTSLHESLEEMNINKKLDEVGDLLNWKIIEKEDIESKLETLNKLDMKKEIILFSTITIFSIIIPQIILSIYPLFINYRWLKYPFAIYSIISFVFSMILMLGYMYRLFKNIKS